MTKGKELGYDARSYTPYVPGYIKRKSIDAGPITAIIPTYRSPDYLDLCLKSATENRVRDDTEIIVIIDGFVDESMPIVEKYENVNVISLVDNRGMQYALNVGVMNAETEYVFIMNDDNMFGEKWDEKFNWAIQDGPWRLNKDPKFVLTINQVEPAPSIFNFIEKDFGRTAEDFDYDGWLEFESSIQDQKYTFDGKIFPFLISKKLYMAVGGFDTFYDSPFWCDVDFFLKLELLEDVWLRRWSGAHLYHFGGRATKTRQDSEAAIFQQSESVAAQQFIYKWGYLPDLVNNSKFKNNSKFPLDKSVKGVTFEVGKFAV
jgi:glycosyltransferase involved in cell wall biosynthesis